MSPDPWFAGLRWRYRRWRARTRCHQAWLNYLRWPGPDNRWALDIAEEYLRRVEASRP
jgi:hypothetical protein